MNGARCEYYTSLIAENSSNQWNLFRTTKSLLCEPSGVSFPKDIAPDDLANDFGNFFMQKIDKINQLIDMQSSQLKGLHIKSQHTDSLLQPIAKKQESHLKDTTDFINLIENTHILDDVALATLDVSSFYTNIPQTEGIDVICRHYEDHYEHNLPIPTNDLRELLRLILEENSFKFNERHFIQTHGAAMGTKTAVSFSVIFMADLEKRLLMASPSKPLVWKRFIDDIFSLWNISMQEVSNFVNFANTFHPTIKFTCEMSSQRAVFLDTEVFKGPRLTTHKILDLQTHFKPYL